jgi:hypothetical protein
MSDSKLSERLPAQRTGGLYKTRKQQWWLVL